MSTHTLPSSLHCAFTAGQFRQFRRQSMDLARKAKGNGRNEFVKLAKENHKAFLGYLREARNIFAANMRSGS